MSIDIYRAHPRDTLGLAELSLYLQIMDYRAARGLDAIPLSRALTTTAARHVLDTRENIWGDGALPADTSLHSWSDAPYQASTPEAMWEAPERLGTGYASSGYEISAAGQANGATALAGWRSSPGHNAILTNTGPWATVDFQAIGVGLDASPGPGRYGGPVYHVWFGEARDAGVPLIMGAAASERIAATAFADRVLGGLGNDTILGGTGADFVAGGRGADRLGGGGGADRLFGGVGSDALFGRIGNDRLIGGTGDDGLSGYRGNDRLVGGLGHDVLAGGWGADVFDFNTAAETRPGALRDEIVDFARAIDRIDLSTIDADATLRGNQAFVYIGGAIFHDNPRELRLARGILAGDVNGDGVADFEMHVAGRPLLADNFIL